MEPKINTFGLIQFSKLPSDFYSLEKPHNISIISLVMAVFVSI